MAKPIVLIIEDDEFIQKMYKAKFLIEGYDVLTAADGEAALILLSHSQPDVVLLDIMMPKMNGIDVLKHIRGDERIKNVPVVMLTNQSDVSRVEEATTLGISGYLIKSSKTPNEIARYVQAIIAKKDETLPSAA